MVYVASRFEISRRRENLSWSHHAELAAYEPVQQERWLDHAESNRLSVLALRQALRDHRRRTAGAARSATHDLPGVATAAGPSPPARLLDGRSSRSAKRPHPATELCPTCGSPLAEAPDLGEAAGGLLRPTFREPGDGAVK
jgi:hypothetical protein